MPMDALDYGDILLDSAEEVSGGFTRAWRRRVTLKGGRPAFIKAAVDKPTQMWLRRERQIYDLLGQRSFLPETLGWIEETPMGFSALVLEDLGAARWPPPWDEESLERVLDAIASFASVTPPDGIARLSDRIGGRAFGWHEVAREPDAFLALGYGTEAWFERALPVLLEAQDRAEIDGDALLHFDLRSDNLCLTETQVKFIDWGWAVKGSARLELARFLPGVCDESGTLPERWMPDGGEHAALVSGNLATQAARPEIPEAPAVRAMQRRHLQVALAWATRALGISAPDLLE